MPLDTVLDELLDSWKDAREGVIAELSNIPEKEWNFRPTPHSRSVRELAQHILEVAMLMVGEFTRPDTNLQRSPWPKLLAMYARPAWRARSRTALLKLLRTQLADGQRRFRAQGELALFQFIRRFDGKRGTKLAWVYHGIAQEEYHRGQLALYARLLGRVPALTKAIQGG